MGGGRAGRPRAGGLVSGPGPRTEATMGRSRDLLERRAAVVPRGIPRVTTATVARARGARLEDADGRELIDFAGGLGVMNAGHGRAEVIAAIREQAERLLHTCIHVATYEPYVALCEKLVALLP